MSKATSDTLQKVSGEFEGEMLADLQEGKGQALALIDAAKREAKGEVSKILEAGTKQAEALKRQIVGAAELQARNAKLKVLEKAVNEAISSALSGIPNLERKRYERALGLLVSQGVAAIGPRAKVFCSAKDRATLASVLKELNAQYHGLVGGEESLDTSGGVALTTPDGSVRFDNTVEARLERLRPTLRKEVADLLSG